MRALSSYQDLCLLRTMPRKRCLTLRTERVRRRQERRRNATFSQCTRGRTHEEMTDFGGSDSSNISVIYESLFKEESNLYPSKSVEVRNFDLSKVKEEISFASCENTDISTATVKEEMHSEVLSDLNEPYDCNANMKKIVRGISRIEGLNDGGTPFCFVGIKVESDDFEGDASCANSETMCLPEVSYPSDHERECNIGVQVLKEKLRVKLSNASSICIGKKSVDDIDNFHSSEDSPGIVDKNCGLDSNSVADRCDRGHSRHEYIRATECQGFPILCVKQKEKTGKQVAVNTNNPGTIDASCGRKEMTWVSSRQGEATEIIKQMKTIFSLTN